MATFFLFDPLSVFFLFVIGLVFLPSLIYAPGYWRGEYSSRKMILGQVLLIVFTVSMALVVTLRHLLAFLVAWEIMSLVSYFLVVFDMEKERSVQAGMIYVIMTHIGTAFLIAAFLILSQAAGSFDFDAVRNAGLMLPARMRNIVFLLLIAGFGTKAGIVPLHVWLPYAHPQAPTPISSLMSGVMIKTAVYGIVRFVICLLGVQASWWGMLVLVLAGITCLVGVLYALLDHDLKRLLAYCSVENIGVILLGIGLSMYFSSRGMIFPAVFSLAAGLYHVVNHAIFKGLLFLAAGSVYKATGTRNMEKLGGLIRKMPQTAFCFLIGAMGISALPPFNGFISEWLTLQAFFMGMTGSEPGARIFLAAGAVILALTGGLAAAAFVKAFGITFLALPRSRSAEQAREQSLSMTLPMFFLAALTLAFGLSAVFILKTLAGVAGSVLHVNTTGMPFALNNFILSPGLRPGIGVSVPVLAFVLVLLSGMSWALLKRPRRICRTWDCGYYKLDSRNEYTATAFSKPFRLLFSFFLLPYRKTRKIRESFYHVTSFAYETRTTPVFKKYIYSPILHLMFGSAKYMRRMQPGSIHLYLSYIFVTVMFLLLLMNKF